MAFYRIFHSIIHKKYQKIRTKLQFFLELHKFYSKKGTFFFEKWDFF